MDGHGTSPLGRCEGIPDPSEVSSLGKLSVFLISYNLIALYDIITDLEKLALPSFCVSRFKKTWYSEELSGGICALWRM